MKFNVYEFKVIDIQYVNYFKHFTYLTTGRRNINVLVKCISLFIHEHQIP
jgi:hypothetical protein